MNSIKLNIDMNNRIKIISLLSILSIFILIGCRDISSDNSYNNSDKYIVTVYDYNMNPVDTLTAVKVFVSESTIIVHHIKDGKLMTSRYFNIPVKVDNEDE